MAVAVAFAHDRREVRPFRRLMTARCGLLLGMLITHYDPQRVAGIVVVNGLRGDDRSDQRILVVRTKLLASSSRSPPSSSFAG